MKYRVVGWTEFDDPTVDYGACPESALQAIIADIRLHGYDFTGTEHQENINGAPVLNDGKKRLFSQREFGGVMAKAHGDYSLKGYINYAFGRCDDSVMPDFDQSYSVFEFEAEQVENETITVEVDKSLWNAAKTGNLILPDSPELTFIDRGDTLRLIFSEDECEYLVKNMERRKNFTREKLSKIVSAALCQDKKAEKRYNDADWIVELDLSPVSK